MNRRRALAVLAAAIALLVALNALVYSLYRSEVNTVAASLDDRLTALGGTAARFLATTDDPALLAVVVAQNRLEDAYIVDPMLRVVAGVRTKPGSLNLLRVDQDRMANALAGKPSVGNGYSVANASVETAYFPMANGRVLALEAGEEFHQPEARLRTTYLTAVGISVLAVAVFALALLLALRALERTRLAYGRAERLAAVGQMSAMVAHEVRNPLAVLRAHLELARERDAAQSERYNEMLGEVERINGLTKEFMTLARDTPLVVEPIELTELAREVAANARLAIHTLEVEVSGPTVSLDGDRAKLQQALYNLVINAGQVGAQHVRIEVAEGPRITVSDDGPGIPADVATTLFDPFVTKRPGGSGLGLAVVRHVVERHGGTIELEPAARGARFSIILRGAHGPDPDRG
ncbi:MAG: sensor histidine kinase [Deltaproteobacteria bacterium]|nr:sensor histidine kinase [Deltaproteobacteria bacterium]